jgi:uncharacterized cupredoxin-like copper-binding protein
VLRFRAERVQFVSVAGRSNNAYTSVDTALEQCELAARTAPPTSLISDFDLERRTGMVSVRSFCCDALAIRQRMEEFMISNFQQQHGAMLLKYSGISFISGAVNHGFFSGERSLWTAGIGMILFVTGAWLEHRVDNKPAPSTRSGLLQTLALGSLLSIGLGFFTGGLQHFPDSPARSAWVVPLGFLVSVVALALSTSGAWQRAVSVYMVVLGALVSVSSYGAWQWFERHPDWAATGHQHGAPATDHHDGADRHRPDEVPMGMTAAVVSRSVQVRMDDQMRFTPSNIAVQAGETIRFVVHNAGNTAHEMVLGSDEDIRLHAQAMRQGGDHGSAHQHGTGAAISVAPGQTGELVVSFVAAAQVQMACLIPGHYEAGMRGTIQITSPKDPQALQGKTGKPLTADHDHNAHKH